MSIETAKQYGKDIGIFYGSMLHKVAAREVNEREGAYEVYQENFRTKNHQSVMKAASELMSELKPDAVSLRHIKALATVPRHHNEFSKIASDIIFDTIADSTAYSYNENVESGFKKVALISANNAAELGESAMWVLATAAALGGAGAGALYWHGDRELKEDEQENMAKQKKIDYYRKLVGELDENLDNEYTYDRY